MTRVESPTGALIRLANTISWLDNARLETNQRDLSPARFMDDSTPATRIVTHWIAYITDRMRPWQDVWQTGTYVFSRIATDFETLKPAPDAVDEFLRDYRTQATIRGTKMDAWFVATNPRVSYRARYPADDQSIYRTLRLLSHFGWSFTEYIETLIRRFAIEPNALRRIAHCLDILTYRLEIPETDALRMLTNADALAQDFLRWDRYAASGHKRLWAARRDYRKPSIWNTYLKESSVDWPGENFGFDQLELPGDVWNNQFFRILVAPLAKNAGISTKGDSSTVARRIYDAVVKAGADTHFYPEQFDASFEFAQRMCSARACWYCPFWKGRPALTNPEQLCRQEQGKACAVALATCGYLTASDGQSCPICIGLADGLCEGLI